MTASEMTELLTDNRANPPSPTFDGSKASQKASILQRQRARRARFRRIDFYASPAAAKVLDRLQRPSAGGDASSILNQIVEQWARNSGII